MQRIFTDIGIRITIWVFLGLFIACAPSTNENKKTGIVTPPPKPELILPNGVIPFNSSRMIILKFRVNDSLSGNFLFDTGSDQLYLDSTFIANNPIPISTSSKKKITGVGAEAPEVPVVDKIKLELDSLSMTYKNVPVTNLHSSLDYQLDGVIGTDFFRNNIIKISFDSLYFQIIDTNEFVVPKAHDTLELNIIVNRTIILCEAAINDTTSVKGWTILDTGSGGSLTLTSIIAKENSFEEIIDTKYSIARDYAGYGGRTHSYYFRINEISMGAYRLNDPVVNYSTDDKGALSWWGILGLLGTQVLNRFDLVFDLPHKKLYYRPNTSYEEHFHSNATGIVGRLIKFNNDTVYMVKSIIKNSISAQAGIIAGDRISHLNDIAVSKLSYQDRRDLLRNDSTELNITFKRDTISYQVSIIPKEIL